MPVRKRWATPQYAAVEGLLLRDKEPEMAANGAAFLPPVGVGEDADVAASVARKSSTVSTAASGRHNEGVGNRQTMRNGQNKRMRGRNNHRKSHNPMARVYESNGPDVKIRGNPSHIAEKYIQLARDAQASGDAIAAEHYHQHAVRYYREIAAAQEQFRQNNPHFARPETEMSGARDEGFEDGDDEQPSAGGQGESPYGTREPQPYIPRDAQPFPQQQHPPYQPRQQHQSNAPTDGGDVDRLPSFITGAQQPPQQPQSGPNGHDNQPDRFPLHRRRRRHRGPRHDMQGGGEGADESSPRE